MSTVPIFAPDGTLGDIPADKLVAAVRAGAKPGVHVTGPDGSPGVVPADRTADVVKAGGKLVPFEEQPVQHQGFWNALKEDLKAMIPSASPYGEQELPGRVAASVQSTEQNERQRLAENVERTAKGYGPGYRGTAQVAEALGVNVPGMEKAAEEGDIGGVAGHAAAVPAAMGATALSEGVIRNVPAAAEFAGEHLPVVKHVVRANRAIRTMADVLEGAAEEAKTQQDAAAAAKQQNAANMARIVRKEERPYGPIKGRMDPQALQQAEALRQPVHDVIDQHIEPTQANHAESLRTKAEVNFHLQRGDVAAAEAAMDEGAKRANPDYQPPQRDLIGEEAETRLGTATPPEGITPKQVESKIPTPEQEKAVMQASDYRAAVKKAMEKGEEPPSREQFAAQPDLKETARRMIEEQQAREAQQQKMTPPEFMQRETRQIVPSVQNIRENLAMQRAAEAGPGPKRFDLMEDKGIQQRMQQDLEEHGSRVEEEARREFIARNSTGVTKGQLTGQAPMEQGDLTAEWTKALDEIRKRRQKEQ